MAQLKDILTIGTLAARPVLATAAQGGAMHFATDNDLLYEWNGATLAWVIVANYLQLGATGTTAAAGNDARLSDSRTPTAHATSHKLGGTDLLRLDELALPTADVNLNTRKLIGVLDPTAAQDAATKAYVDAIAQGLSWKAPVRVATTVDGARATAYANGQTVDGVALATGDRILLKNQTAGAENGLYVVAASGAPARSSDANSNAEVTGGLAVLVQEGTVNADTAFTLTNNGAIVLDTTALVFAQFSSSGATSAHAGSHATAGTDPVSPASIGAAAATHVHAAADTTSGIFAIGRLASGTPDGTKFVRDDGTLVAPTGIGLANPMTAAEDIIFGGAAGAATRKAKGNNGQFLGINGSGALAYLDYVTILTPVIDGGGAAITVGVKMDVVMPWAGIIESVTLLADQSGSIVLDFWKDTYANYPPTVADTITASAKPTISATSKSQDAVLTGWTRTFAEGDVIRINVDSVATIQRLSIAVKIRRTA